MTKPRILRSLATDDDFIDSEPFTLDPLNSSTAEVYKLIHTHSTLLTHFTLPGPCFLIPQFLSFKSPGVCFTKAPFLNSYHLSSCLQ